MKRKRSSAIYSACICSLFVVGTSAARPTSQSQLLATPDVNADVIGDFTGNTMTAQKSLQDTVWIATWTFDLGAPCSDAGWTHVDNHVLNDGVVWWHIETGFTTGTGMTGHSAAVGSHGNLCCADLDGYRNDWYQGIRMTYTGNANLSLDYIVDSEASYDFLKIETDSLCSSYARVNFQTNPRGSAAWYRTLEVSADGTDTNAQWVNQPLSNYGPGTHCVYISFFADGAGSPCDGEHSTTVGEGAVVDNIVLVDGSGTRSENFEDGILNIGTFLNMADSAPFGTWARLFKHITENDLCQENTTCAWLFTDNTTPTIANDPSMAFAPGGFVIRNWLDDMIVSPWVSLATTPTATGMVLSMLRFPGNPFITSRIVSNWSIRARNTSGTPCISDWYHASSWDALSSFAWQSLTFDATPKLNPATDVQVRFRISDWQWIRGADAPTPFVPGPGPFIDRVSIGRLILSGPVVSEGIDSRFQGQDCFPTQVSGITPGEHFLPTTDRYGSCAFSMGAELGVSTSSPNLITGDSVTVQAFDARGAGGLLPVRWIGAIVRGPHIGKAPAPYAVGANGFFAIFADTVRTPSGSPLADHFFVDLDDTYFRGDDELHYAWLVQDASGGWTSSPSGLTGIPVSVTSAQQATNGLHEVSFLPTINWDPAYLAAIQAHASGDINPTAPQLANSEQRNAILYVNNVNHRRRSGDINRTAFMYTLDRLGYRNHYDTYDHTGMGNTNNQLGGRATVPQAQGYNLIVYDNGNGAPGRPLLPDGVNLDSDKVDQAQWFRDWLSQAAASEAQYASLWMIGSNTTEERGSDPLIATNMGVALQAKDQALNVNPNVDGLVSFTFDQGTGSSLQNFTTDLLPLNGGCPEVRNYDAITSQGTAVTTHRYRNPTTGTLGGGAVVMNRNDAQAWNTIMMSFAWSDIMDADVSSLSSATLPGIEGTPSKSVAVKVISGTLPAGEQQTPQPTDTDADDRIAVPGRTRLYPNAPNPFNPMTTIRFDLSASGHVSLKIYSVDGRLVRRLIDGHMSAGANLAQVWDGFDESGTRAGSGVYICRLEAADARQVAKMLLLK